MKHFLKAVTFLMLIAFPLMAQGKPGTPAEAEAMVKKAIDFYKANGPEKTFKEVTDTKGRFVKGDLYVLVYDLQGNCMAHGGNSKQVGKNFFELKDNDGKAFVKERIALAKSKGKGWQNYNWTNPVTKAIEKKTVYIEKVDEYIFGCGAYSK